MRGSGLGVRSAMRGATMKPRVRGTLALIIFLVGCFCAVAWASRPDHTLESEMQLLVRIVAEWTARDFQDEEAFFKALPELTTFTPEMRGSRSLLLRLVGGFERRFYFGPPVLLGGPGPARRAFAVTSFGAWGREIAFCADTTPLFCTRHDGFEPRVRAGRCDDPRCEGPGQRKQVR